MKKVIVGKSKGIAEAEQCDIHVVSNCNIYGFKVGKITIDIEEETEQKAIIKLVNEYWELIDKDGKIELCGLLQKVKEQ